MAAYLAISEIQSSNVLVVELSPTTYEIIVESQSVIVNGNDLTNYLNSLPASVKVSYQFLEDFS